MSSETRLDPGQLHPRFVAGGPTARPGACWLRAAGIILLASAFLAAVRPCRRAALLHARAAYAAAVRRPAPRASALAPPGRRSPGRLSRRRRDGSAGFRTRPGERCPASPISSGPPPDTCWPTRSPPSSFPCSTAAAVADFFPPWPQRGGRRLAHPRHRRGVARDAYPCLRARRAVRIRGSVSSRRRAQGHRCRFHRRRMAAPAPPPFPFFLRNLVFVERIHAFREPPAI